VGHRDSPLRRSGRSEEEPVGRERHAHPRHDGSDVEVVGDADLHEAGDGLGIQVDVERRGGHSRQSRVVDVLCQLEVVAFEIEAAERVVRGMDPVAAQADFRAPGRQCAFRKRRAEARRGPFVDLQQGIEREREAAGGRAERCGRDFNTGEGDNRGRRLLAAEQLRCSAKGLPQGVELDRFLHRLRMCQPGVHSDKKDGCEDCRKQRMSGSHGDLVLQSVERAQHRLATAKCVIWRRGVYQR